jgi:hypothetical protein
VQIRVAQLPAHPARSALAQTRSVQTHPAPSASESEREHVSNGKGNINTNVKIKININELSTVYYYVKRSKGAQFPSPSIHLTRAESRL